MLAGVEGIARGRDRAELLLELRAVDDRAVGRARERALGQERALVLLGLEGEERLPRRRAVQREWLAERGGDAHRAVRLDDLDRHEHPAPQHGDVGGLAHLAHQLLHDRAGLPQEPQVQHVALPELEAAHAEAVVLGRAILLDVAARLEGREQPKDVVLVQLEPLRQLGDPELVGLAAELLEHVERVRYRLDDVVGFLAPHARPSTAKTRFRLRRSPGGVNASAPFPTTRRKSSQIAISRSRGGRGTLS